MKNRFTVGTETDRSFLKAPVDPKPRLEIKRHCEILPRTELDAKDEIALLFTYSRINPDQTTFQKALKLSNLAVLLARGRSL